MNYVQQLCAQFQLKPFQVENTLKLLDEDNTIPFIARYRKELTGSLDDQLLRELSERYDYLRALQKRREEVLAKIEELGALTDELAHSLDNAKTLAEIEDLYRPYKPKRKTRASVAKEKGLEPLADLIFEQADSSPPLALAVAFVDADKGVETAEDAVQGAMDIIAERISDNAGIRSRLRMLYAAQGVVWSKAATEQDSVYALYYDFSEPVARIAGHRILALDRGEREAYLKVSVTLDAERAMAAVYSATLKATHSPCRDTVMAAAQDAYDRLIQPSVEREVRAALTEKAADAAIRVFAVNLQQLLMQPPVKGSVALGLDPAYRTGCKFAIVDKTGLVLETGVVYPTPPHNRVDEAKKLLSGLMAKHDVDIIAIGNGTASKETEIFTAALIAGLDKQVYYMVVSEAGASVYSASKLAAKEFPQLDVSLRSAISIARRLQDPLAELVKIDPKAIGVGQYQHDMPAKKLGEALDGVVEASVNAVGVNLNTASPALLTRVAGVNAAVADSIVAYREAHGAFQTRAELKKVPKLGPKAFKQAAGFLRVPDAKNVLDNTAVHPESYDAVKALLKACHVTLKSIEKDIAPLNDAVASIGEHAIAEQLGIGVPTLKDILAELAKPGRDVRDSLPKPLLRSDVMEMKDLKPGLILDGTVRNVIDFGVFVDIAVHQDGLVHISQITDRYIKHPSEVLKVGDIVKVQVLSVDVDKKRIALTMKIKEQTEVNA